MSHAETQVLPDKNRKLTLLNPTLDKKLVAYASAAGAAGVGLLALAQPAEARIVFTPIHQVIAPNTTFNFDLNADGINDFGIQVRSSAGRVTRTFSTASGGAMLVYPLATANRMFGSAAYLSALPQGVQVGPNGKFPAAHYVMGGVMATNGGPANYEGPWAPSGATVRNHYLGLKFVINGQVHFGWARLTISIRLPRTTGVRAVLTGYAYEKVVNKPIITGKTSSDATNRSDASASEMSPFSAAPSLGLLAQGAPALAVWRREDGAAVS